MKTLVIRLASDGSEKGIPKIVQNGIWTGGCMDLLYNNNKHLLGDIKQIVIVGALDACSLDGFQEFLFDLLTNFFNVEQLSMSLHCPDCFEGRMLSMVLQQFHQVYPDRTITLGIPPLQLDSSTHLLCDLTTEMQI